jgi:acetoin utilization deacetylase AcuC-like enzyme
MTEPRTGFYLHPASALHDPGWGHPEHQGRLPALAEAVGRALPALHERVVHLEGRMATVEELGRVHPPAHLARVRDASARAGETGRPVLAGEEVPLSGASWDAILGSVGCAAHAAERIADGRLRNAFVATRPPGHHASAERAMGFCAVNNVAVVARHLQARGAAAKIAIVDWDVHHGNGTQDIFYEDPSVFFLSLHQWPFYPGTGAAEERGEGPGKGATLNVPLAAGTPRAAYAEAFADALAEAEGRFTPDFVLISAGFDALAGDPIGGLLLEPEDYAALTDRVLAWADRACGGRVLALLEGGYDPVRTGEAAAATLVALARGSRAEGIE